jgi:PAS domain S-box-containing protein
MSLTQPGGIADIKYKGISEEERLRSFFLQAPAAIVILEGRDHVITLANRLFQSMTGREDQHITGRRFMDVFPELHGQGVAEILNSVYTTGKTFHGRAFPASLQVNGNVAQHYFDFILQALTNENGEIMGLMGHAVDISDQVVSRRQLEEKEAQLTRTQQQLQLSLHAGEIGLWHWDVKRNILSWSREQLEIFGLAPEEFKGTAEDFFSHVLPEDKEKIKAASRLDFERSENEYQFRIRRKDGSVRWIQSRSKTIADKHGAPEYITGVNIDITGDKEIEHRLKESEEFSRSIIENSPDCYKILDTEGRLQYMNEHGKEMMEIDGFHHFRDKYWWEFFEPEYRDTVRQAIVLAGEGKIAKFQAYCKTAKGSGKWWDIVVSGVGSGWQGINRLIAVSRDITEQRMIAEKIRQSEEKYRMLSESLEKKVMERTDELRQLNGELAKKNLELDNSRSFLQQLIDSSVESISVVDRQLHYITVNKAFERIYKVDRHSLIGKPLIDVNPLIAKSEKMEGIKRAFTGETVYLQKKPSVSNPELFLDTYFIPLSIGKEVHGVMIMSRDVTGIVKSEKELENKNKQLNEAQELARLGSWEWDFETQKVTWSEQMYRIYGYDDRDPMTLERATERMLPADREKSKERIAELYERLPELFKRSVDGKYHHIPSDYTIQLPDGSVRLLKGVVQLVFTEEGRLQKIVGTVQDVTVQRQNEERLQKINKALNEAQELAMLGNWEWDLSDNSLSWSANMYNIYQLNHGRPITYDEISASIHPKDREMVGALMREARDTGEFPSFYHRIVLPGGKVRIMFTQGEVIKDKAGKPIKMVGTEQDVTRQRLIEKKLIRANRKLVERNQFVETLIHSSLDVIMVIDRELMIVTINNKAEMLLSNYFDGPFINRKLTDISDRIVDSAVFKGLKEAFTGKLIIREKLKSSFSDHYFEHNFVPLFNEKNEVYAVMLMSHDITDSIRQMEELKRALEADEMKSDFIRMASHELKTPVTSIKGYIQLLLSMIENKSKQTLTQDVLYSSLSNVGKQVDRLTRLLSELLDLSRIELGQLSFNREPVDMNELVDEISEGMMHSNPAYKIEVDHQHKAVIQADRDRIGQVLINILSNAIKYSPKHKKIEVVVKIIEPVAGSTERRLSVSIRDHGIGISKEEFDKIFNRFYRAAGKNEQTYPGFGIGLFIAREIIERHGGSIQVDSVKGSWTQFTIELPASN